MALLNPFRIGQGVLGQQLGPYPYGSLGADKVPYWDGNTFKIPQFTPKPYEMAPQQGGGTPSVPSAAAMEQPMAGILGDMYGGDGGAGNGFGGGDREATPGMGMGEVGHVNAPDISSPANANPAATQAAMAGIPSLPSFNEPAAPSAPTAPAEGLAAGVPGSEANAPMGGKAGKSGMTGQQAASQAATQAATANTAAAIAAVDKAVQENPASFMDAVRSAMQATAPGIGMMGTGAEAAAAAAAEAAGPAGVAGSNQNSPNEVGGMMGGDSGMGGVGPGGDPNGPAGSPGSEASSPDNLRYGGRTGDDGDGKLEVRNIKAHEFEFMLNPEMTMSIDKVAPGLLNKIDAMQKKMAGKRGLLHR